MNLDGFMLDVAGDYMPGDPQPDGYLDWHEWARVQSRAGLRQVRCPTCSLFRFPQELSDVLVTSMVRKSLGTEYAVTSRQCFECGGAS